MVRFHRDDTARSTAAGTLADLAELRSIAGDYQGAEMLYEQSTAIRMELGQKWGIAQGLSNLARAAAQRGDFESAAKHWGEKSLALHRERGVRGSIARVLHHLGVLATTAGDYARGERLLNESLALYRDLNDERGIAHQIVDLGYTAWRRGDYAQAATHIGEGLPISSRIGYMEGVETCLFAAGVVAHAQGVLETAARLMGAASRLAGPIGRPVRHPFKEERERRTDVVRKALGPDRFNTAWAAGEVLTLENAVQEALAVAESVLVSAATRPRARLSEEILSRREREVAGLVARGLPNRAIAQRLFISERTADTHVQHILNKLGFSSRTQIATWAVQNGLTSSAEAPPTT